MLCNGQSFMYPRERCLYRLWPSLTSSFVYSVPSGLPPKNIILDREQVPMTTTSAIILRVGI